MSGMNITVLTTAANTPPKVKIASHFRRFSTSRATSSPLLFTRYPPLAALLVADPLRDQNDIPRLEDEVLCLPTPRSGFFVIERDSLRGFPLRAEDDDAAGPGDSLECPPLGETLKPSS